VIDVIPSIYLTFCRQVTRPLSSEGSQSDVCLLEQFLRRTVIPEQISSVAILSYLAQLPQRDVASLRQIGGVRGVRLYRHRRAPLHHEFAIISFGNGHDSESWMRVERAAALRSRWFSPRMDSSGPFIGGAKLRETISYATRMESLIIGADELACVTPDLEKIDSLSLMPLNEFAVQLQITSDTCGRYKLLTSNCRWFARRIVLNFAERMKSQGPHYRISWAQSPSSFDELDRNLREEPFGGRQLGGRKNVQLNAANLTITAWNLLRNRGLIDQAIDHVNKAVAILETLDDVKKERDQYLVSIAHHILGMALMDRGSFLEALIASKKALEIIEPVKATRKIQVLYNQDTIARSLHKLGRFGEAVSVWGEIIPGWREQCRVHDDPVSTQGLADALHSQAIDLVDFTNNLEEAITNLEEAIRLKRKLYIYRPRLYSRTLEGSFSLYADFIGRLGNATQALAVSNLSVTLSRESFLVDPDGSRQNLARTLHNHSLHAARLRAFPEALEAGAESEDHWRLLYAHSPDVHRQDYANFLDHFGLTRYRAGRREDALISLEKAAQLRRVLHAQDPDRHWGDLLGCLGVTAAISHLCGDSKTALALAQEAVSIATDRVESPPGFDRLQLTAEDIDPALGNNTMLITQGVVSLLRQSFDAFPDPSHRAELAQRLSEHAAVAASLGEWDNAWASEKEAMDHWQDLVERDSEVHQASLANSLRLLASYLRSASHAAEALKHAEQAVDLYRSLMIVNPDEHGTGFEQALTEHAHLLDDSGRPEAALSVLREAIILTRARYSGSVPSNALSFHLASQLCSYGLYAAKLDLWDEACDADQKSLQLVQQLYSDEPASYRGYLARILYNTGLHLRDALRPHNALSPTARSIDLLRMSDSRSNEHRESLAAGLALNAHILSCVDRAEEAFEASVEAIALTQESFDSDPDAWRDDLAHRLHLHASVAASTNRLNDACHADQGSIDHFKVLFSRKPDEYRAVLAAAYNNLAMKLELAGHDPQSVVNARKESLVLVRQFNAVESLQYQDRLKAGMELLVDALVNLGIHYYNANLPIEAVQAQKDALVLIQEMETKWPGKYHGHLERLSNALVTALNNQGSRMEQAGLQAEALASHEEALAIARQLFALNPGQYVSSLSAELAQHALRLSEVNRSADALLLSDESIAFVRDAFKVDPNPCREDLAKKLGNHGVIAAGAGCWDVAIKVDEESLQHFRYLFTQEPDTYRPYVITALRNMGLHLRQAQQPTAALGLTEEVITLLRTSYTVEPEEYRDGLKSALSQLAETLDDLGRQTEAFETSQEALSLSRVLFDLEPDTFRESLAVDLDAHSRRALGVELWDECCNSSRESVKLARDLFSTTPDRFRSMLAGALNNLHAFLRAAGQPYASLDVLAEAVELYRNLYSADPDVYRDTFSASLLNLAMLADDFQSRLVVEGLSDKFPAKDLRREAEVVGGQSQG
jgi:tetratricopeptide (TPR) repeat protein